MVRATDEPARIIWHAETTCVSSFQTVREGIRETATEEAWAMQARTAALFDETDNNEEIEEWEDDAKLFDEMEVSMDAFITRRDVTAMIADKPKGTSALVLE